MFAIVQWLAPLARVSLLQTSFLLTSLLFVAACSAPEKPDNDAVDSAASTAYTQAQTESCINRSDNGIALFGDVHVHTSYSFDAAAISTGATPVDAHRFARGEVIPFFPINDQGEPAG